MDSYISRLRVIGTEAGVWGVEAFLVLNGASFQSGEGDALFYYTCGVDSDTRRIGEIITEQAGDRSLDDTVAAIQSRVGLYLAELQ